MGTRFFSEIWKSKDEEVVWIGLSSPTPQGGPADEHKDPKNLWTSMGRLILDKSDVGKRLKVGVKAAREAMKQFGIHVPDISETSDKKESATSLPPIPFGLTVDGVLLKS